MPPCVDIPAEFNVGIAELAIMPGLLDGNLNPFASCWTPLTAITLKKLSDLFD